MTNIFLMSRSNDMMMRTDISFEEYGIPKLFTVTKSGGVQ